MVTTRSSNVCASVQRHKAATITDVDYIGHVIDDHDDSCAATRPFRAYLLSGHGVLSAGLRHLDQVNEATFAFFETSHDRLVWELREVFVLHNEIMKIVTEVIGASSTTMAIEHAKKANLGPLHCQILLALGLEDVKNNGDTILVVVANDSLVGIGCVTLDHATLLL